MIAPNIVLPWSSDMRQPAHIQVWKPAAVTPAELGSGEGWCSLRKKVCNLQLKYLGGGAWGWGKRVGPSGHKVVVGRIGSTGSELTQLSHKAWH